MSANCSHNCAECHSDCNERTAPQSLLEPLNKNSSVKKVIGVVSGKGGVGKSLVTSMLAVLAQRKGYQAAILPTPDLPATRLLQKVSLPIPIGVTGPTPVITTLLLLKIIHLVVKFLRYLL